MKETDEIVDNFKIRNENEYLKGNFEDISKKNLLLLLRDMKDSQNKVNQTIKRLEKITDGLIKLNEVIIKEYKKKLDI